MSRVHTVHTLEEWNAIIEHEIRSFAKALQGVKKQLQPFIQEEEGASIESLEASFERVERQIRSVVTILEDPDPVFEAFNEFDFEFERQINEMRINKARRPSIATDISQAMIELATAVKNAEFLIFKGEENGPEEEEFNIRRGSMIFGGRDELSLARQEQGLIHVGGDGQARKLFNQDLPPVLDLENVVWSLDSGKSSEVLAQDPSQEKSIPTNKGSDPLTQAARAPLPPPLSGPPTSSAPPPPSTTPLPPPLATPPSPEPSSPEAPSKGEAALSPKRPERPDANRYTTFQMSAFEKGFGDHLANFTAESARLWKWLCLDPDERSAEKGRQHFNTMVKHVNHICAQSTTPTLGVDKQLQKITLTFQMIDLKAGEPIPRFLMQQVTESLVCLAGIIKGTIALNILNSRNSIFLKESKANRPRLTNLSSSDPSEAMKVFRIMVVGHDGVGKSTLIRKFCQKDLAQVTPTQGIELKVYKFQHEGEDVELQILDAAGKRFFRDILDEFYNVVEGIMIVYDISSSESFGDIHLWMRGLEKYTFLQKIIVGNKCDLGENREVPSWRAQNLAEEYNVQHLEASCENGLNVEHAFLTLIKNIHSSAKSGDHSDDEADNFVNVEVDEKEKNRISTKVKKQPLFSFLKKINKYTFLTTS